MTSVLEEQLGVASSARHWDVDGFRLYESTVPGVLLHVASALRLARDADGHRRAAVTGVQRWTGGTYEVLRGSAVLGFPGDAFTDPATAQGLQDTWSRVVLNTGYDAGPGGRPRFVPLPVRDVHLSSTVDPAQGAPAGDGVDAGSRTLVLDLTAAGARDWAACVRGEGDVPGAVRATYTYPQVMPPATATVRTHGRRVHEVLSGELTHAPDGTLFGDLAAVRAAWTALVRTGAVEVVLSGAPPADLSGARDDLVEQVREQLFDALFVPYTPSGADPGSRYALRFRRAEDVPDLPVTITVEGWTWLSASLEAPVADLLRDLDAGDVLTSYEAVSVPVSLVLEPSPQVRTVAVSLDFGDAHVPQAPTFTRAGGTAQYLVTTEHPDRLAVAYRAKVDFEPAGWAVVEVTGTAETTPEGFRVLLDPGRWVRRHTLYAYVRQGQRLLRADETDPADALTVTVTRVGAEPSAPARASARVTPAAPVQISYPVPPGTTPGGVTLSAVGMVAGRLVRGMDLRVQEDEEALYLLVDEGGVQLVGRSAVLPESDPLVERLRRAGARPVVSTGAPPAAEDEQSIDVQVAVELVPQPTDVTCWAASLAMVVGARDSQSVPPATIAAAAGMDVDTGYGWGDIQRAVAAWDLVEEGPRSAVPAEWARLLQEWGPIWIVEVGAPYHAVVVAGVWGDGTAESTYVLIYNPWPPGSGVIEWKTFVDFDTEFGLGAGAGAAMVHAGW